MVKEKSVEVEHKVKKLSVFDSSQELPDDDDVVGEGEGEQDNNGGMFSMFH